MSKLYAALLGAVLLQSVPAAADGQVPIRPTSVSWARGVPHVSFSALDFATKSVAEKLGSGLPQRIVTRVYAYPEGGEQPIAVAALSCRVVYDLWEGVYRVEEQTEAHDRSRTIGELSGVLHGCLDVRSVGVGSAELFARFRGRRIYFAVIIELNPLSPDVVQRIRRWLSKAGSGQLRGDAFFGSFVSIFVSRRMGSAERSSSFRSVSTIVPPP